MPARRKAKRVVVVKKRGGSLKSVVNKALNEVKKIAPIGRRIGNRVKKTYASKIKPLRKRWFPMPQVVSTPNGLVNVNPPKPTNGLLIDNTADHIVSPAHPKYRQNRKPYTTTNIFDALSRLPAYRKARAKRGGFVALPKATPIGLHVLQRQRR